MKGPMQDDTLTVTKPPQRRRSGGKLLAVLLIFVLIAVALIFLALRGHLDRFGPGLRLGDRFPSTSAQQGETATPPQTGAAPTAQSGAAIGTLETRLALLEDRFSRISLQADAASGNAARAEGLLIAAAARRLVERGEPLGYVADQLRLRFADAQPRAVQTLTEFARAPVTIDELSARLDALAPELMESSPNQNFWQRTRRGLAALFVVHSDSPTLLAPTARIERVRLMLTVRRIGNAVDEVRRLPGAETASKWIADAQRFQDAQHALELIETTAMLEPSRLKDGTGQNVRQPSPLSTPSAPELFPTPEAAPSPPATANSDPAVAPGA